MATATVTNRTEERQRVAWQVEEIRRECARSLTDYLGHVRINSRPKPMVWGECIEAWQWKIVKPMIPAIEFAAGLRDEYTGPRNFFYVLPKGHDKTGLIGRLANWAGAYARRPIEAVVGSGTRDQAGILLRSMKAEIQLNPWLAERLTPMKTVIEGPGGFIKILSSDAWNSSGLIPDIVILDEITFWGSDELWNFLLTATEKRPGCVLIIIANAGLKGSWQHHVLLKAMDQPESWHVYQSPLRTHFASWMNADEIAKKRLLLEKPGFAQRVYDNEWIDATERPLLRYDLIKTCFDSSTLWPLDPAGNAIIPPGTRPELYIGIDVGRTQDRTVIWTDELIGDVSWAREIKVLHNCSFAEQKQHIEQRLRHKGLVAVHIDKGGIGYQLAEELETAYPRLVEGVALSSGRQGQIAAAVKTAFEGQRKRVPNDSDMINDFQLIEEYDTGSAGLPTLKTNKGETGHGDRFWAMGLATDAMPVSKPVTNGFRPMFRRSKLGV